MTKDTAEPDVKALVAIPAVIALAITLIRLVGELADGPELLFNRAPGGDAALIGIVWLVPVFGAYFGLKLSRGGFAPASPGRVVGRALLGIVVAIAVVAAGFVVIGIPPAGAKLSLGAAWARQVAVALSSLPRILIVRTAWPAFFRTILAYAFASRIPVAIVMLIAMNAGWGTHYEFGPPEYPEMGLLTKWIVTGLLPQMTFWILFTVLIGTLFGGLAARLSGSKAPSASSS